jgi:crotonobetaine/carnitine-CoA ligase
MTTRPENILANLIANRAEELPDFEVLTFEGGGARPDAVRTYRALWDNARRMAQVLLDRGVQPGDRFALLMANHPEFVEAMIAASIVGAAVVPIDPRTKGEKLHFMLASTGCGGVLADDYGLAHLHPLRPSLPALRWVLAFATDEGRRPLADEPGVIDWAAVAPASAPDLPVLATDPESALELLFTSGTTGDPKGIVMTHRRYCETALLTMRLFSYRADDRLYSGLSLTHANAQLITLGAALACRLPCVLSRRFTKSPCGTSRAVTPRPASRCWAA